MSVEMKRHRTPVMLLMVLAVCLPTGGTRVLRISASSSKQAEAMPLVQPFQPNLAMKPTPEEAQEFIRANLDPQIKYWQQQEPKPSINTLQQFTKELVTTILPNNPLAMREIGIAVLRNNTLTMIHYLRGKSHYWRFECLAALIKGSGMDFPNTAFLLNLADYTLCKGPGTCAAPVFSAYTHKDDTDLILPVTNHRYDLQSSKWEDKVEVAFGRASHNYHITANSSMNTRAYLALGSVDYPDRLDYGLTKLRFINGEGNLYKIPKAGFVDLEDHLHWKYLISTDGTVSSNRLGKLLLMNSVTLKEDSPFMEYYYRSLQPWVHFVPFQSGPGAVSDILAAVDRLRGDDTLAQKLARTGQEFAAKFLLQEGRAWYLRELLLEYNKLFGAGTMEQWVAQQGPEALVKGLRQGHQGHQGHHHRLMANQKSRQ